MAAALRRKTKGTTWRHKYGDDDADYDDYDAAADDNTRFIGRLVWKQCCTGRKAAAAVAAARTPTGALGANTAATAAIGEDSSSSGKCNTELPDTAAQIVQAVCGVSVTRRYESRQVSAYTRTLAVVVSMLRCVARYWHCELAMMGRGHGDPGAAAATTTAVWVAGILHARQHGGDSYADEGGSGGQAVSQPREHSLSDPDPPFFGDPVPPLTAAVPVAVMAARSGWGEVRLPPLPSDKGDREVTAINFPDLAAGTTTMAKVNGDDDDDDDTYVPDSGTISIIGRGVAMMVARCYMAHELAVEQARHPL